MKLLFAIENQIHTFTVQGAIERRDLQVLRLGVSRFLESKPSYVILDLSPATLSAPDQELQSIILELKTIALSRQISFYVAQSDIESIQAHRNVTEMALTKQVQILQNKVELREKLKAQAEQLLQENSELKSTIQTQFDRMKELKSKENTLAEPQNGIAGRLNPMMEKLWSEK